MTRLNGWQRLWIVLSAIYLLLLVGLAIDLWPRPETTSHREEFLTRMPAELRARIDAAYATKSGWDAASPSFVPDPQPVEFPNGAVLRIRGAKAGDTEPDVRVAAAYWAVVESATRAARWRTTWVTALVWLVPCLTLYALGWAVAWVRRGFSRA